MNRVKKRGAAAKKKVVPVSAGKSKVKKLAVVKEPSESSSEEEEDSKDSVKVEYAFSQKSFKSIFSGVQSELNEQKNVSEDELLKMYENDPLMKGLGLSFDLDSPKKTIKDSKKVGSGSSGKSKPKAASSSAMSSSSGSRTSRAILKCGSLSSALDRPVTESQLAVADLDTDTELDGADAAPVASGSRLKKTRSRNGVKGRGGNRQQVVVSSDDEDELQRKYAEFIKKTDRPIDDSPSKSSDSIADIIEISSTPMRFPSTTIDLDADDGSMRLRIKFRGTLYKIEGNRNWDVETVRQKLSELVSIPKKELLLYTEDSETKMIDGRTLSDYNIEEGDFMEAMRRGNEVENTTATTTTTSTKKIPGGIRLKFQKAGLRKPIILTVSKYSTFEEIRTTLAAELKADGKKLQFNFDGERIELSETPEAVDLEDDFCIDVHEQ